MKVHHEVISSEISSQVKISGIIKNKWVETKLNTKYYNSLAISRFVFNMLKKALLLEDREFSLPYFAFTLIYCYQVMKDIKI